MQNGREKLESLAVQAIVTLCNEVSGGLDKSQSNASKENSSNLSSSSKTQHSKIRAIAKQECNNSQDEAHPKTYTVL
jgi:hypothetical protein